MNKFKLLFATVIVSASMCFPALAGMWTHTTERRGDLEPQTYESLWFYIKDDGTYAKNEWIIDTDGTWYWIDSSSMRPIREGVSKEGYLYDSDGKYVDMSDGTRKYLSLDLYQLLKENMTYDQVVGVLGKEHATTEISVRGVGDSALYYTTLEWYSADADGSLEIEFINGVVKDMYLAWY